MKIPIFFELMATVMFWNFAGLVDMHKDLPLFLLAWANAGFLYLHIGFRIHDLEKAARRANETTVAQA